MACLAETPWLIQEPLGDLPSHLLSGAQDAETNGPWFPSLRRSQKCHSWDPPSAGHRNRRGMCPSSLGEGRGRRPWRRPRRRDVGGCQRWKEHREPRRGGPWWSLVWLGQRGSGGGHRCVWCGCGEPSSPGGVPGKKPGWTSALKGEVDRGRGHLGEPHSSGCDMTRARVRAAGEGERKWLRASLRKWRGVYRLLGVSSICAGGRGAGPPVPSVPALLS